jgi:hypothetical protein
LREGGGAVQQKDENKKSGKRQPRTPFFHPHNGIPYGLFH